MKRYNTKRTRRPVVGEQQSQVAYAKIRSELIRCRLTPGTEVSEVILAARFGFGRAAVRTALAGLCREGLVQAIPRRGYLVTPITLKDVLEIFDLRMILEPAIARLAAGKVSRKELVEADHRWSHAYKASGNQFDDSSLRANKDFHLAIARATGNKRLVDLQAKVLDETDRLIYLGLPIAVERSEIQEGHKPLISALTRAAPGEAEIAAAKHVETAKAIVADAVMSSPSILGVEISAPKKRTGTGP